MARLVASLIDRAQRIANRVDSSYRERARDALDEAIQWHAMESPWDKLLFQEDFPTSGSEYLTLPDRVARPVWIADATNRLKLQAGGNDWADMPIFLAKTGGTACEWKSVGVVPVTRQPETASRLVATASVSESFNIGVKGLVEDTSASGTPFQFYEAFEELMVSDDSGVTSANEYVQIYQISKERGTSADVRFTYGTDETVSRIPSWESQPRFHRLQFMPVPPANISLRVSYFRRPDRITSEAQPLDPNINEEALVWRAAGNIHWHQNELQNAQLAWAKADQFLAAETKQQETHGERDHSVQPWFGYLNREGIFNDDSSF